MHVLLVEDDDLVRCCLSEVLAESGAEVIEACDAECALEMTEGTEPPAIIVTDVNLGPGMDGFEFAVAIRRRWPATPVLLISGVETNMVGRRLGPLEGFLPKPFSCATLLRNIDALTARRAEV